MESDGSDRIERTPAADLWRNTLLQIPSVFGRLVYLSSLRNDEHRGVGPMSGEDDARRALRNSHASAFAEWLSFNLEEQKTDLDLYLSTVAADKSSIPANWLSVAAYRTFIPDSATTVERRLYAADLEALIALLRNKHGAVGPDRAA
jgi:hypothetical protein